MASHDQQLKNRRYRDWVKAGLALKYLKDGVEDFVNDETKDQQKKILEEVQKELGRPEATCNSCPIDQLLAHKRGRYKKGNFCPNDVCDIFFDKIVEQHMYGKPSWSNTDSTKWCTEHWEIAKCFIDGGGYGDKVRAADTDCKGLLSIITNSMFVQRNVDTPIDKIEPKTDVFSKAKKARNEILHLASLQLPVETLNGFIDVMIQILEDKGRLHEYENAKQAIAKLRQLKETDLFISTEDEWETRKSALKAVQERKQEALDAIEKKQNEIIEKLQIDKIQETLDDLSKTSKETSQSFSNRHKSLEQRQTVLESTLEQTQKLQKETSQAVVQLQQDVANLKARFDAFDEVELQHKKRVTYLDHKKVIRQELFNMYSKYLSNIPVPPLLQKLDATVDEFYMELEICDDRVYEKRSKENRYNGTPVTNYREIFYKEGNRVENIYVLGEAGVGKTTWCLKLIHTWLQGSTNQETESTHSLNLNNEAMYHDFFYLLREFMKRSSRLNVEMMLEFDFVLFVSLRHASKEVDLIDMIRKQLFHQTPQRFEYMQEIMNTEPDKCLVIADGLDEWNTPDDQMTSILGNNSSFPSRKNMNHCTVISTTRPWKLNEAQPSYSEIDRAVIILGFVDGNFVRKFAEKVIYKLNQNISREASSQVKNEKKVEDFEKELHKRFPIQGLQGGFPFQSMLYVDAVTQIPLILIIMVVKWFNDGSLESTMAGNYSFMLKSLFDHEEGYRNIRPRFGKKLKLDGRLSRVSYIEEAKLEWSIDAEKLPECVRKHTVCCQYSRLILKLSEIAFVGLFDRNEKALIFSEDRLLEKLSSEEVEVAVKSGILSKSDVVGTCNMSKLSFLHKTVQEFLAAIHLVVHHEDGSCFQKFEKYCFDDVSIYEMQNVILFSSGLDLNLTIKILKHVRNVGYQYFSIFFDIVVQCINELRESSYVASMPIVTLYSFINNDIESSWDKGTTKQLEINMCEERDIGHCKFLDFLFSKKSQFWSITTLKLEQISGTCLCLRRNDKRVVFNLPCLRNLELCHINTDYADRQHCVFDFSNSRDIEIVNLNSISSFQFYFNLKTLKDFNLKQLKNCNVRLRFNNDAVVQAAENTQTMCDDKNGINLNPQCTYYTINELCMESCSNSMVSMHFAGGNENTNVVLEQIASLFCKDNVSCEVKADLDIRLESVRLISIDKAPDFLFSKKSQFCSITTLILEQISGTCLCLRTNDERVNFNLTCLRNLELCHINTDYTDRQHCVFDFSNSRDIESVNLNSIFSSQLDFSVKNLKYCNLKQLRNCYVRLRFKDDVAVQAEGNNQNIFDHENGINLHPQCTYPTINSMLMHNCSNSMVSMNFAGGNENTNGVIAQITSLFCKDNMSCDIEADLNIRVESVRLIRIDNAPKIHTDFLYGINCQQNMVSFLTVECDQCLNSEVLKSVRNLKDINNLRVIRKNERYNVVDLRKPSVRIIKNESEAISNLTLEVNIVQPSLKNAFEPLQSLVNLKCLKCVGLTEKDLIMLGQCFQYFTYLEELELSNFWWNDVGNKSAFSCLERFENLKTLSLKDFKPAVISAISLYLPNLRSSELILERCFPGIVQCLINMGMLKKLTVKLFHEELADFIGFIKMLKQVESLFLITLKPLEKMYTPRIFNWNENLKKQFDLRELVHLVHLSYEGMQIRSGLWQIFLQGLPKNGQLKKMEFPDAVINDDETKQMIKSTPGFVCQKWERVGHNSYNFTLKAM